MDLLAQLPTLEVHDSILKSLTFGFDEQHLSMEVDFYKEQTGEYVTSRWKFRGVAHINMTNLDVRSGDVEIFSLDIQKVDNNATRILFQFLQGPGSSSATLDFLCEEGSIDN